MNKFQDDWITFLREHQSQKTEELVKFNTNRLHTTAHFLIGLYPQQTVNILVAKPGIFFGKPKLNQKDYY